MKALFSYFLKIKQGRSGGVRRFKIIRPLQPLPFIWALIPVKIEDSFRKADDRD
jgi:hypothetical protein